MNIVITERKTKVQKKKQKDPRSIQKLVWLRENRGVLSEIARRPNFAVSESFVRLVFWANPADWKSVHSTSKRPDIEAALKAAGAPL